MMEDLCSSIQAGTTSYHNDGGVMYFHPGWNHILPQWWKIFVLPSRLESHPAHNDERLSSRMEHILLTMMKDFCTYIHPGGNTSCSQWWKGSTLTSIQERTHPSHNDGRALHLHSSRIEHILLTMMKGLCTYIHPGWNTSYSQWWKGLHSYLIVREHIPTIISEWPPILLD